MTTRAVRRCTRRRAGGAHLTKLLLDKGADVNARTKTGVTPVMSAAAAKQPDSLRLMLEKDADVNARDDEGKTPLDVRGGEWAARQRQGAAGGRGGRAAQGQEGQDGPRPPRTLPRFPVGADNRWEYLKEYQEKSAKDAEALRALLKRAGG